MPPLSPVDWSVGRGIADVTGEAAGCGMLGYGKADQRSTGIHLRQRARAFVFVDADGSRVLLVIAELPLMFDSVHRAVLARLADEFGDHYTVRNTMLTVTHTHCGPGGYSDHELYNTTTDGFHPVTFTAIVDGIVEAVGHAHADIAPATVTVARGELHDASVNRSPTAFARNPAEDRAVFPDAIDPAVTVLRIERGDRLVGAITWFATHGTSMTNTATLISSDNKGYAAYHWERELAGADYLAGQPELITAFAQTNAGDMSPNLNHAPGSGPTDDEVENTRLIGLRQAGAARATSNPSPLGGRIDARLRYVDLAGTTVRPEFTPDGREHRTGTLIGGAAALAGTDEGPGFPGFRQGRGRNHVLDAVSRALIYPLSRRLREAHAPKALALPGTLLNHVRPMVAERYPVQLVRLGPLHLVGIPGEVTIVAGLRIRRAVAAAVHADPQDVLVAGYSNGYLHYVTTPEEYVEQRYEGASTLFGRWEQPALAQVAAELGAALRDATPVDPGPPPPDLSARRPSLVAGRADRPAPGHRFGDVVEQPAEVCRPGGTVRVIFAGAKPAQDVRRGDTFLRVEREEPGGWVTVADDGDWATTLAWEPAARAASLVTITWQVPTDATGRYRIRYYGDACSYDGTLTAIGGTSRVVEVRAGAPSERTGAPWPGEQR